MAAPTFEQWAAQPQIASRTFGDENVSPWDQMQYEYDKYIESILKTLPNSDPVKQNYFTSKGINDSVIQSSPTAQGRYSNLDQFMTAYDNGQTVDFGLAADDPMGDLVKYGIIAAGTAGMMGMIPGTTPVWGAGTAGGAGAADLGWAVNLTDAAGGSLAVPGAAGSAYSGLAGAAGAGAAAAGASGIGAGATGGAATSGTAAGGGVFSLAPSGAGIGGVGTAGLGLQVPGAAATGSLGGGLGLTATSALGVPLTTLATGAGGMGAGTAAIGGLGQTAASGAAGAATQGAGMATTGAGWLGLTPKDWLGLGISGAGLLYGQANQPNLPNSPDYLGLANLQGQQNKDAALYSTMLANPNFTNPYGSQSVSYERDPATGNYIPRVSQQLNPVAQSLFDQQLRTSIGMGNLAEQGIGRVGAAMGSEFNPSLPALSGGVSDVYGVRSTIPGAGDVQRNIGGTAGGVQYSFNGGGPIQDSFGNAGNISDSFANVGSAQRSLPSAGQITRDIGNVGDVQRNMAGIGNIRSTFANVGGPQTSFADVGGPQRTMGPTGQLQTSLNFSGAPALPGTDDSTRQRVEDALYARSTSRLDPEFQLRERQLETKLLNAGIERGTEAWNNAMGQFSRDRTDAYDRARESAISAGGTEQSRLFGLGLQSRQQSVGETTAQGQFANSAQAQDFNQQYQRLLSTNQAQAQAFLQAAQRGEFGNAAQAQAFNQAQSRAGFENAAQGQDFTQKYQQLQATNQAQAQAFLQAAQRGEFGNQAQQQAFSQSLAGGNFANAGQAQDFSQAIARGTFGNQAQQQRYGQMLGMGTFANQAQQQRFGQNLAGGQFTNQAQGQDFNQQAQRFTSANQAQQQQFNQNTAATQQYNSASDQFFRNQLAGANFGNQARNQALQEALTRRQLPLNEFNAFRSGSQVTLPNFQGYNSTGAQAAPTLNAATQQYGANLDAYNANVGQRNSTMNGLFGIGSSFLAR